MSRLKQNFFEQDALTLAPLLLGKILCRKTHEGILRFPITETEAYFTERDTACHAHRGKTARTEVMYRAGGCAYIYLCYGIHHLLNIVCGREGSPEAVLIRGAGTFDGPGKLTRAMQIDKSLNGVYLTESDEIWLEDGVQPDYISTKRIGIDYATEEYKNKLWRYVAKNE